MKIYLILTFGFILIVSVSANQVTLPVQQYPVYQQSVYNSPAIPVVYQAAPTSYHNPCNLHNTVQNQIPNQIANALVSKVLSNPSIHRIFDPNTQYYNQNGAEFQKPVYNTAPVPNIINNYFIVSPEYLKFNDSELISEVLSPQVIAGENHNILDIVTNIPQFNTPTKENLVQASLDKSQTNVSSTQNGPYRKVRRKKGRKRIRGKLMPPLNRVKETSSNVPVLNSENKQIDITNNVNSDISPSIHEEVTSNNESKSFLYKHTKDDEIPIKVTTQEANSPNNKRRSKKKSKKRTQNSKSLSNTVNEKTESVDSDTIEFNKVTTEANSACKQEINQMTNENDLSKPYVVQESPKTELNEECFADIGSLIYCLDEADSRVTRNSKDEAILRDFRQEFPDVPENVARSMLSYVQNQYQNHMDRNFCCPGGTPQGYNHLFQMPYMYNFGRNNVGENKPRSKSRRRKNRHRKKQNKKRNGTKSKTSPSTFDSNSQSFTAKIDNTITDITPTTEILNLEIEDVTSINPKIISTVTETLLPITEEIKIDYDYSKYIESEENKGGYEEPDLGYREDKIPELGEEDTVPLIYTNGLIDDYYPTFTDSAYYANNNEFTVADLSDRYYYTTDRNIDNPSKDRTKIGINFKEIVPKLIKQSFRDTRPKHTYFDADKESYKNLIKEIIQPKSPFKAQATPIVKEDTFQIPPGLENPDFRTKRIDKNAFKLDEYRIEDSFDDLGTYFDYGEKSSIYSNAKTPLYNSRSKPSAEMSFVLERPVKSSGSDVETSFARSKVAKYGVDGNNDNVSSEVYHAGDDEVSVVTAQSLRYSDEVW